MILNGQTGILGLDINPVFNIVLDVLVLGSLIYALYVLFKAGVKGGTLSKTTSMSSILILLGFSVFIGFKATLSVTTTITLTLFIVTAVTTLLAIAIKKE